MSSSHNKNTKKVQGWNVKELVEHSDTAPQERVDLNPEKFDSRVSISFTKQNL